MYGKTPLLWLAIPYLSGIIICTKLSEIQVYISILLLLPIATIFIIHQIITTKTEARYLKIPLLLILPILILGIYNYHNRYQNLTALTTSPLPKINSAVFKILTTPDAYIQKKKSGKWRTQAQLLKLNGSSLKNPLIVTLSGKGETNLQYNDIINTHSTLYFPPEPPSYSGGFSQAGYYYAQGIAANFIITGIYDKIPYNKPNLHRYLQKIRIKAIQNTLNYCPGETGAFLTATILGYRQALTANLEESFRNTGIGHILAISGLHIGLIILIINFICKRLHLTPRQRAVVVITACLFFLLLSGARSSVVRASIITFIYFGGILLYRQSNFINSLAAAALLICLINPLQVFDVGFQLSFISVTFISIMTRRCNTLFNFLNPYRKYKNKDRKTLLRSLLYDTLMLLVVSISAWLGILPLSAYYFHSVSIIGFLTNLVIIPIMPFTIAGGLIIQLAPLLPNSFNIYFAAICSLPAQLVINISEIISSLPVTAVDLFPPSMPLIFIYYSFFAIIFIITGHKAFSHKTFIIFSVIAITLITAIFIDGRINTHAATPSITVLRSRNGESMILRNSTHNKDNPKIQNDNTVLIIQESESPAKLLTYLYTEHIRTIDTLYYIKNRKQIPNQYTDKLNIKNLVVVNTRQDKNTQTSYHPARGINITITRNNSGRISWYNINLDQINLLLTNWQKPKLYHTFCTEKTPGYNAPIKILRITGYDTLSTSSEQKELIIRDKSIKGNKSRKDYGIIKITREKLELWEKDRFISWTYPAAER